MISLFGTSYRFHILYQGHWFLEMQRGLKEAEIKQKPYSDDADLKTDYSFFSDLSNVFLFLRWDRLPRPLNILEMR